MNEKELKEYIEAVEQRTTKMIEAAEKRLKDTTDSLDECVKELKRKVAELKLLQINCIGLKDLRNLQMDFTKHLAEHEQIKEGKELGITKFRVYAFIFFAFVAMAISIWNAFFKG